MARHRRFSFDFKRQLVLDFLEGREGLREIARKHSVSRSLIRLWIQKYESGQLTVELDPIRIAEYEGKVAELERRVGQLTMEVDLLRKGARWARRPNDNGSYSSSIWSGPGETKNREGRTFPLTTALCECLVIHLERTRELERQTGKVIPWIFHRNGRPIRSFRDAWRRACLAAGVPGWLSHEFRRTAVRNLERVGVPRSAAMAMVGHKTEAIYRRYAILDEGPLPEAAMLLDSDAVTRVEPGQKTGALALDLIAFLKNP
jgi:transposase-like protein